MADMEKVVERLFGSAGGETAIRHRSGLVTAVPAAGFVDVERVGNDIPVLAGNWLEVGDVAHCLVWSGGAIAIGRTGLDTQGPKGVLGYAQRTTNATGITDEVNLLGLVVTVVIPAGRQIKVTGSGGLQMTGAASGDRCLGNITEDDDAIQRWVDYTIVNNNNRTVSERSIVVIPTAGEHTYRMTARRVTGTGAVTFEAHPTVPAFILVEDIGPA